MKIDEHEVVVINNDMVKVGCQSVRRETIMEVLRRMDEWKPAPKFAVGDFVRVLKNGWTEAGKLGKILVLDDVDSIGVEFPHCTQFVNCSLNGKTKNGHGVWFTAKELEKTD